jgi:hypothetical protein
MIGVPYAVLAGLVVMIYRCCKAADQRAEHALAAWARQQHGE